MIDINGIEEIGGEYIITRGLDKAIYPNKKEMIKAVARMTGVAIITSDEVKNQVAGSIEKTDWDTDPISHDGIQFNKHFIELKIKVASLESALDTHTFKINEICNRVTHLESKNTQYV